MELSSNTQDTYMPDPGIVDTAYCGVCGTKMDVTRNVYGATSYVSAIANNRKYFDFFKCPYRQEDWHSKVVKIRRFMKDVPSDKLCSILEEEVISILEENLGVK